MTENKTTQPTNPADQQEEQIPNFADLPQEQQDIFKEALERSGHDTEKLGIK